MDLKFNTTGFFLKFTEINCNILRLFGHFAFYGNVKRLRVRQSIYTLYIIHVKYVKYVWVTIIIIIRHLQHFSAIGGL